jgi:hypothetical protein
MVYPRLTVFRESLTTLSTHAICASFPLSAILNRGVDVFLRVDKLFASAGLTMDAVMAQTLSINIDDIERIDRMIATAEVRRRSQIARGGTCDARS